MPDQAAASISGWNSSLCGQGRCTSVIRPDTFGSQSLVKELSLLHLFRSAGSDEEEHVPIEAAELAGLRKEYPSRRF